MHNRDMIHRDIKPANIFVQQNKNGIHILKLGDFGSARQDIKDAIKEKKMTKQPGSPGYWPPEKIKNEPYTAKFDVWSTGVTFFELLTGNHPFIKDVNESPQVTETAIKETEPNIPKTLSPAT